MASITITYTPQYSGCHRIWLKQPASISYCVYEDLSSSIIDTPKDFVIDVTEDVLTCLNVQDINCTTTLELEGFIIPCCASENDPTMKVDFTFNAGVVQCKRYIVECKGSGVRRIDVTNPGSGYSVAPTVFIPGAEPPIAVAYLALDSVDYIEVTDPGSAIAPPFPPVTLSAPDLPGGVQATAEIAELYPCGDGLGTISITDCLGNSISVSTVEPLVTYFLCSITTPINNQGSETTVTPVVDSSGCCNCKSYRLDNPSKYVARFEYFDCDQNFETYDLSANSFIIICAREGSINFLKGYPDVTVTDLGQC